MTVVLQPTEKSIDAICTQDASHLGARLAARMPAGVLSRQKRLETEDWEGTPLCYLESGMAVVVGKVDVPYHSTMYVNGQVAVDALGACIGPQQASEFGQLMEPVYFTELKLVEYYGGMGEPPEEKPEPAITPELSPYGVSKAREGEPVQKSKPVLSRIAKASKSDIDPEWMYVLSVVLEPNDGADGAKREPDYDNEVYDRHFIRKVAFPYVRKYRGLGIMHNGQRLEEDVARVVQSYVVDDGFSLTDDNGKVWGPGTWFLGSEVKRDSDLGQKIESGEIGAYSIDGMALKAPESEVA